MGRPADPVDGETEKIGKAIPPGGRDVYVLAFYALFFLLLFLQFPLKGAIPGNCDSWLLISLSNSYVAKVGAFFSGSAATGAMFPAINIHAYGESAIGTAGIFIFFKLLGASDITAYYLFISTIFILTAYGIYKLAFVYTKHTPAAVFAGFAFTCSNFIFANIDDSLVFFYFFSALSLYYLKRYLKTARPGHLFAAAAIGGIEMYFSMYVFIFQTIILGIVFLFNAKRLFGKANRPLFFKCAGLYALLPLPYFLFYLHSHLSLDVVNPFNVSGVILTCSLIISDLIRVLPDNLIYPTLGDGADFPIYWAFLRKHAFIGISVVILAAVGFIRFSREKAELLTIGLIGFFFAFGPTIHLGGLEIPSPLALFYEAIPLSNYLRVPIRGYFLFSFTVSIFAAWGLLWLIERIKWNRSRKSLIILVLALSIHFLENTPQPLKAYVIEDYQEAPRACLDYFKGKEGGVILDLPSEIGIAFAKSEYPLFQYNREIIYINWQTRHSQNIIGGVNGYYPRSRLEIQKEINAIPHPLALAKLARIGVDHIVFHKQMTLPGEGNILKGLDGSRYLVKVKEDEKTCVFKLNIDELSEIVN